jgi:hypothetical protein
MTEHIEHGSVATTSLILSDGFGPAVFRGLVGMGIDEGTSSISR